MSGQKHLVQCRCILPQFKKMKDPLFHKFVVFSLVDENDMVKPKIVQCNNCGVLHKITDFCRSEILTGKENLRSISTIEEVKSSVPDKLANILETNSVDLATWEHAQYIIENKLWGESVVLSTDVVGNEKSIKMARIIGENLFSISTETINLSTL